MIRSFEAKYNVISFMCNLVEIRKKTFTVHTIKHSFQNTGIWPVSFVQVKVKIKEYSKRSKKDLGLASLEFGYEPNSEIEAEPLPTELNFKYDLLPL